jgi:hypothetical protein
MAWKAAWKAMPRATAFQAVIAVIIELSPLRRDGGLAEFADRRDYSASANLAH